jgi:D-alanyl-D-alanine carboxypeptidase
MRRILFLALLSCAGHFAYPQAQYVTFRIDSAIRAAIDARQIPGLQVAVIKFGLVLKKGNYGYANLEDRTPVTDSTLFSIASLSKAFTCAGILLLMEDGKLSIDDSVGKYFDSLPAAWAGITLRRLMNQTSGIRDDWGEDDNFFYTRNSDSALFAALKSAPLIFQPGERWSPDCGPFVLGLIIAKVSGETYPDFMKHRIFDKLAMTNSRIDDPDNIIPNRAAGYRTKGHQILHGRQISAAARMRGDVGVLTTVTDMLKWYQALQDSSLLKKSSLDLMFTPGLLKDSSKTGFGFGWSLDPYRDHALISQAGNFRTGYNAVMEYYPEDHVGIIILCNLCEAKIQQVSRDIVGLFNPDYRRASQLDSVADPDSVRTLLLKSYYEELGLNVDTTRKMAREMHLIFYPEQETDLDPFRNITEFTFVKSIKMSKPQANIFGDPIQGIYLYRVKSKSLSDPLYLTFYLDPTGKVVYMNQDD